MRQTAYLSYPEDKDWYASTLVTDCMTSQPWRCQNLIPQLWMSFLLLFIPLSLPPPLKATWVHKWVYIHSRFVLWYSCALDAHSFLSQSLIRC